MDWKTFAVVFGTVFLAELGDKTQLATILFAGKTGGSVLMVFVAASMALVASTALAVTVGTLVGHYVDTRYLTVAAGVGFILIGVWTVWSAL